MAKAVRSSIEGISCRAKLPNRPVRTYCTTLSLSNQRWKAASSSGVGGSERIGRCEEERSGCNVSTTAAGSRI